MSIPVDSADVAEQREIEQARAQIEADVQRTHDAHCVSGWVGETPDGRPVPCALCRPRLLHIACPTCQTRYEACALQLARRRGPCCDHCRHSRRGGEF